MLQDRKLNVKVNVEQIEHLVLQALQLDLQMLLSSLGSRQNSPVGRRRYGKAFGYVREDDDREGTHSRKLISGHWTNDREVSNDRIQRGAKAPGLYLP